MSRLTLIGAALVIGLTACPQAVPVVGPAANLAACIATDVAEGKGIGQIATDCGVDVLTIVEDLLASQDPKVQESYAYNEARTIRMQMKAAP